MNKTGKKSLNNNDEFEENADFGHFRPFLACFWPLMALVWVFKGPSEYTIPSFKCNEWDWKKILNNNDQFEENADFDRFWPVFGL